MSLISKNNIITGQTIQAEHVTRIIDALNESGSSEIIATGSFTGSFVGDGSGLINLTVTTASYALNSGLFGGYSSSYFATTGSNTFNGNQTINGDVTITGTASIAVLHVTYESASVIYSSGSNQLGDAVSDTQTLIGTVNISGSLNVTGSTTINNLSGSLFGTASWAQNAVTASYINIAASASYATTASYSLTASYLDNYVEPFPYTGSAIITGSLSVTGSITGTRIGAGAAPATNIPLDVRAQGALSSDTVFRVRNSVDSADILTIAGDGSASFAGPVILSDKAIGNLQGTASYANTASYVETSQTASYVLNAISSSYATLALSASYAPGVTLNTGKTIYVATTGNDSTGAVGNISKPYLTLESASLAATSGDTIIVFPGSYTVTTTATNGIAKDGVNYFFHPGTTVSKSSSGHIFYDTGFTLPCNVFGYGSFSKTTSTGKIYFNTVGNAIFEALSVTSSIDHCFQTNIGSIKFKVDYATSTAGAVLYMNQGMSGANNINIDMIHWKSTATSTITGDWWYYTALHIKGNRLESTAEYALYKYNAGNRIKLDVDLILGVTYGIRAWDGASSMVTVDCTYITGISEINQVSLNGYCGKLEIFSGNFTGGICGDITVSGGSVNTIAGLNTYTASQWVPILVSGGVLNLTINYTLYGLAWNITGGVFNLYGIIQAGQISNYYDRVVNGGTMNLYARMSHAGNPDYAQFWGMKLQSGTLRMFSNLHVGFDSYLGHGIIWTGGNLIIENSTITTTNTLTYPIQALASGLQLRVNGRLAHNRTENGSLFSGKKHKIKYNIVAVSTTTIYLNDGTGGDEIFSESNTGVYNTKALLAQRMVSLINASATLNLTASQDTPGTDEYFYVECDTAGFNFPTFGNANGQANLTSTFIRIGAYEMTEIIGGTIIENSNIS